MDVSQIHSQNIKNLNLPALDIYLEQMAARERKLFTCSTSSPIVVPAPSWFRPPHFNYRVIWMLTLEKYPEKQGEGQDWE